jgi:hypothetical protein
MNQYKMTDRIKVNDNMNMSQFDCPKTIQVFTQKYIYFNYKDINPTPTVSQPFMLLHIGFFKIGDPLGASSDKNKRFKPDLFNYRVHCLIKI